MLLADSIASVAIWLVLLLFALPALLLLANPQAVRHPREFALEALGLARSRREAAELARYAEEIQVAADRADHAAQRWQEHRQRAETHAADTWHAWQAAEQRLTRARAAAAFAPPDSPRTAAEYADRERFLHRSVRAAVDRGDLPSAALPAAIAGRDGWNPRLHPADQELILLTAVTAHRRTIHRQATVAERTAAHDARLAAATRHSLRREAATLRRFLPAPERRTAPSLARAWVQRTA
ncbi:hypothetical protein ACWT_3059 [Actinoplanes sp. SE50]|uniref:hypothetical protein n=1 Tax=unclassified Actinoplanes TaxID=2626549 RepID=UPI00023EC275|nr:MULTISPECIES: hypothetical protein [unclassified Actinoplanes]AEV84082.1 hypothetical protein ACPL_3187 [Actinoplanes sp. SE50/110]ATO82474.1 hypothetical protein ACWT_3059 [Actinoplanes sp. SE50]SLL99881.1 hypothetical protein ACSP50_3113 [Actinoplanes sp. SE50/110]